MAKYCASCKKLHENDNIRFCPSCGSSEFIPVSTREPAAEVKKPVEINNQAAPVIPPVNTNVTRPPKKKSGAKKFIFAVIAVALVAAIVLNFSNITGIISKKFGSGKSYFSYVEKKSVNKFCDTFDAYYQDYYFNNVNKDRSHNLKMNLNLSDELINSIADDAAESIDLSWLKNTSFDMTVNKSGSKISTDTLLKISNQKVLTSILFVDPENNKLLLKLNEITDDVLKFDMEDEDSDDLESDIFSKVLPESSVIKKIIKKYHGIVLDSIGKVDRKTEEMKIDGISQKLEVLTCTLTEKEVKDLSLKILKEIKADKDIKGIFEKAQKALKEKGLDDGSKDLYASFIEEIESEIDEITNGATEGKDGLTICDYVNSNNEIVGRKIGKNGETLNYLTVESGNKFAAFFNIKDGVSMKETGTKKGDRITSECILTENDETVCKIQFTDFDKKAAEKGKLDGKIRFFPSSKSVKNSMPGSLKSLTGLLDMSFEIDIKGTANSGKATFNVLNGEKPFFGADVTYSSSSGKSVSEPKGKVVEISGLDSLEELMGDLHLDELVSNLRKTDVPKEYVDAIDEVSQQLKSMG